jgi:two-component system chemotaxis response regulator CheB
MIMRRAPTPILMFSSLTREGAQATLDALEAGAVDFLPKQFDVIARDRQEVARQLRERVRGIGRKARHAPPAPSAPRSRGAGPVPSRQRHQLLVIGTSAGGPVALQRVLTRLPASFPLPLLLVQHMPGGFTAAFAERLDRICAIHVQEAGDGAPLAPGTALLAPGGRQTLVRRNGKGWRVQVEDGDAGARYRPCVDIAFGSAAEAAGAGVLAVVLTGMGSDGREGARALKARGAELWAQDEATSVVYGMPMAVKAAGLTDHVLALDEIGERLSRLH